jgi:hypothetical protein
MMKLYADAVPPTAQGSDEGNLPGMHGMPSGPKVEEVD